ncbi:MAG TPA: hypothetical protein VFV93_03290 [Thermomicrobiales bacterium]|nr:hypothetical protein [Thermomicrobiales bacterium]
MVLALALLTTACTTRVTGYSSPIVHDYAVVEWHGLGQVVEQRFVAGPGHQAAIANDGKTTPAQFEERLTALPEDARRGALEEMTIGLRLDGEGEEQQFGVWETGARVQVLGPDGALVFDVAVDGLPREDDWLRIDFPPALVPGQEVTLRIVPGTGDDAGRLQYGVTPDRAPYGGWMATNADGSSAGGALLLRTVYKRDVALGSVVSDGFGNLRDAAGDDPLASALWALAMAGLLGGAGWLWRARPVRGA